MTLDMEGLRTAAKARSGLVPSSCLPDYGVTPSKRRRLVEHGWLKNVRPGVVLVGGGTPTPWQEAAAAALAAGPGAVLSHSTAARAHKLACAPPHEGSTRIELTVVRPARPELAGCTVHRVVGLDPADRFLRRGIPVTSPLRTLGDLASCLDPRLLAKTIDEGLIAGLWSEGELRGLRDGMQGRRGAGRLRDVLRPRLGEGSVDTTLEQRVVRALKCFAPFETGLQLVVGDHVYIPDIAWPERRVLAECDGWGVRGRSRSKFDSDRRRSNLLVAQGWTIVHLTSAMDDDEMRSAVARVLHRVTAG